jgi:hypothetical protein
MTRVQAPGRLQVPAKLESQLRDFRRRVWTTKMVEAAGIAVVALFAAYLCVFLMDRLWDTPAAVRYGALAAALAGCAIVPAYLHRWVWRRRHLEQLARLLSHKLPRVGDQLLGIIELAHSADEQSRSPELCQAAIESVAADAEKRDFKAAAPDSRQRSWGMAAAIAAAIVIAIGVFYPAAASNAWARFGAPWRDTPRYTFAAVQPLEREIVVAHGEPFSLAAHLEANTEWRPEQARLQIAQQKPLDAKLDGDGYTFAGQPLIEPVKARISIGDWHDTITLVPKLRPELTALDADVRLPEYLGQPAPQERDIRGGALSIVKGSRVQFTAAVNRQLAGATIDGADAKPSGEKVVTDRYNVTDPRDIQLEWRDQFGLASREPFTITIGAEEDGVPSVACEDLPRRRVILDSEQIAFTLNARDDFGVKEVGLEWHGLDDSLVDKVAKGEQVLSEGGHDRSLVTAQGTFTAKTLGIEPQPIELRLYATDYYPDRPREYSPPYILYVLDANQHAIWVTEQLAKWQRQALEVRDREMRLYETNKQIREMSAAELDEPNTRRMVEDQAAAERANGRRLASLSVSGEELLRQAARNPEIGVGHLDRWAEILQILQDISGNRMPTVADLLNDASKAVASSSNMPTNAGPKAGQSRAKPNGGGPGAEAPEGAKAPPRTPSLVDMESSQQPDDPNAVAGGDPQKKNPSAPSLRLPVTTLMGQAKASDGKPPAAQKVDEAVVEQKDLLAEFEKVANELNEVLANLEGSTLVKRLKAASREQYQIAGRIADNVEGAFGGEVKQGAGVAIAELAKKEDDSSQTVSYIMDDMEAYFERRRLVRFRSILDEMRETDVIGALQKISKDMPSEQGLSIAQAEYWSDTMDRWAEDLVDPACSGQCPGCRTKSSLPPSIVLEVLQILEGEINLREETRVAEQAKPALEAAEHQTTADRLAAAQRTLDERVIAVIGRIRELPDAEMEFGKELALLAEVSQVMDETVGILGTPDTGAAAIAAETEAIELLLKSKRINPKGGGGGGANPGGGGTGDTQDSALALLGAGLNPNEVREDRGAEQAVGESGVALPAEFRAGLDRYFNELERGNQGG